MKDNVLETALKKLDVASMKTRVVMEESSQLEEKIKFNNLHLKLIELRRKLLLLHFEYEDVEKLYAGGL